MIQIDAFLDAGYSRLRIEGHQEDGRRVCTIVTTIFDAAVAALDAVAEKFPNDVVLEITEGVDGELPVQPVGH